MGRLNAPKLQCICKSSFGSTLKQGHPEFSAVSNPSWEINLECVVGEGSSVATFRLNTENQASGFILQRGWAEIHRFQSAAGCAHHGIHLHLWQRLVWICWCLELHLKPPKTRTILAKLYLLRGTHFETGSLQEHSMTSWIWSLLPTKIVWTDLVTV